MKTVLIAGAGIIGLSTALELATRWPQPLEITVLERGRPMQEASWAAAGMLAAQDPENPPQLAALAQLSRALYPEFLEKIERLSGCAVPLRTRHTLQICRLEDVPDGAALLSTNEAETRVPGLSRELPGSLLWLEEASLDPRDLCRALPLAARAAGVRIVEDCAVDLIDVEQVTAHTSQGPFSADSLILCCGAWPVIGSGSADGRRRATPSLPRKGQMLSVRMPSIAQQLDTVIRSPEIYLVPRGNQDGKDDGRMIIGATVEDDGFDRSIRSASTAWLLAKAAALWPPIQDALVEDVWTGIRPGTPDGLPFIGPLDGSTQSETAQKPRLWLAAGHYRNGILLAPGTARVLASALPRDHDSAVMAFDLTPFDPRRFEHRRFDTQRLEDAAADSSVVTIDEQDSVAL